MLVAAMAVLMFSSVCVLFKRIWLGGNMRASGVVNREKCCCRKTSMNSAPKTTNVAIVRPSFQPQLEPAKVKTIVSATAAPVLPMKPVQSRTLSFWRTGKTVVPCGLTGGR